MPSLIVCLFILIPALAFGQACTSGGTTGTCMDVALCKGTPQAGLCPGAANIQCCIAAPATAVETAPEAPAAPAPATAAEAPTAAAETATEAPQAPQQPVQTAPETAAAEPAQTAATEVPAQPPTAATEAPAQPPTAATEAPAQPPTAATEAAQVNTENVCKDNLGNFGQCLPTTSCSQGISKPGFCPGAANVQCCIALSALTTVQVASTAPLNGVVPPYVKLGDSQTGCPMPVGGRVARSASTPTGPCVGFVGAHIFEIMQSGLPLVAGKNVVVYLGSNDGGYPQASISKFIADFIAAAPAHNVRILCWVGPSVQITGLTAAQTDAFYTTRLGGIPYVSLLTGGYPSAGDRLHFTPQGYVMISHTVDETILQNQQQQARALEFSDPTTAASSSAPQFAQGLVVGVLGTASVAAVLAIVVWSQRDKGLGMNRRR